MPPKRRPPKPRTSRMDAAIDAMKPYGFTQEVVMAKMRELLKEYEGQYMFIELDAYSVLLESLISDQDIQHNHQNQIQIDSGEISNSKVIVKDDHAIVPADGFIDIPVCSSTTHTVLPPPPPPPPLPPLPPPPSPPRRRKPCHGWICDDDDDDKELRFLTLPSLLNGQISPPKSPPEKSCQQAQTELTIGRKKRRSRWDLRPEDT